MVRKHRDEEVIPDAAGAIISAAWDNCDVDATAKYESAEHRGNIVLTVHSFHPHPPLHARLSLEREWEKPQDITFENILHGLERDRHKEIFAEFKQ